MINTDDWNGLNHKVIRERSDELVTFDDYIPSELRRYINMQERNNYLKHKGLYDKIINQRKKKREEFKKNKDNIDWQIQEVLSFVNSYPIFEDFIKIKGRRYSK